MNEAGFSKIAILILAAGRSSRMGKPKQLLSWKKTTLIGNAVAIASSLTNHFLVVLGANALKIKPYVPEGKATLNEKWQEGMGSSLSHGVTALASKYEPRAILVMVADQPLLELEHYKGLIRSHQN
ncbi:MAG: NTP transferase domain-containing protein, partial [Bacteroidota bacterium]